jgi:hypothetical protein
MKKMKLVSLETVLRKDFTAKQRKSIRAQTKRILKGLKK